MRLFIGVHLPYEVRCELRRLQKSLMSLEAIIGNYPAISVMHLTLKFIGDVQQRRVDEIRHALQSLSCHSMSACLTQLMTFGDPQFPSVIYVGLDCPPLRQLVERIEWLMEKFCEHDDRKFNGHLTVARVKRTLDSTMLRVWLETAVKPICFNIDHVVLVQSVLSSQGPVHTDIEQYPLITS